MGASTAAIEAIATLRDRIAPNERDTGNATALRLVAVYRARIVVAQEALNGEQAVDPGESDTAIAVGLRRAGTRAERETIERGAACSPPRRRELDPANEHVDG